MWKRYLCPYYFICHLDQLCSLCGGWIILLTMWAYILRTNSLIFCWNPPKIWLHFNWNNSTGLSQPPHKLQIWPRWHIKDIGNRYLFHTGIYLVFFFFSVGARLDMTINIEFSTTNISHLTMFPPSDHPKAKKFLSCKSKS